MILDGVNGRSNEHTIEFIIGGRSYAAKTTLCGCVRVRMQVWLSSNRWINNCKSPEYTLDPMDASFGDRFEAQK